MPVNSQKLPKNLYVHRFEKLIEDLALNEEKMTTFGEPIFHGMRGNVLFSLDIFWEGVLYVVLVYKYCK
jgi:hypothetical protein